MKKILPILTLLIILNSIQSEQNSINKYENITQDPTIMQKAFCEYNKGKDFITNQCDGIN